MYFLMVAAMLLILPLASILVETLVYADGMVTAFVVGRWFVFWAVGVRLVMAGMRQIIQPSYTAEIILGIKSTDSHLVVRELGFANTALSMIGIGSIFIRSWVLAAAVAGIVFYGLAGINHLLHKGRNRYQTVAMASDLFVALVLLACCTGESMRRIW